MPTLDELTDLLELEPIEPGLFRGRTPQTMLQRVFGGQVVAQALRAASMSVTDRVVHSLHSYFLRPGSLEVPILYSVEATRDGGSFSSRRVVARQQGDVIFTMAASFQRPSDDGFDHQDRMPDVSGVQPDRCPPISRMISERVGVSSEAWEAEWAALDVRLAGDSRPGGRLVNDEHPAVAQVWLRTSGPLSDDPVQHACVLAYASDLTLLGATLVAHDEELPAGGLVMASIDHAMWFHRPFRMDEWLLYDQVSPSASGGRGLATGRLFTLDGLLVASVAQEGLIRPRRAQ